jgi:2-oxoglutarate/2-oxoacid ferredoxin oxidoreductase subunit alpha
MKKSYTVLLQGDLCKGQACALCRQACPRDVFAPAEHPTPQGITTMSVARTADCIGCGRCELLCPDLAIDVRPDAIAALLPDCPIQRPVNELQDLSQVTADRAGGWHDMPSALPAGGYYLSGNEACAEGAIAAGCRFYAGYPITPSSEAMMHLSRRLPEVGGAFIQMEDELGSIAAVIGASWGGRKAMTATSGPGMSLMLENIGYAAMTETPCVIVNAQRAGPSTGQASRPAQADVMQARWGTHGGSEMIALAPWSVQEMYDLTIRAFNLAERFRVPVVLLADEIVAHLQETVILPPTTRLYERVRWPQVSPFGSQTQDGIPPMPAFGEGARLLVTGSTHDEEGFRRTTDGEAQERLVRRLSAKILSRQDEIDDVEAYHLDDAERLMIAFGSTARSALWAVRAARKKGYRIGLLRLKSLWPFPEQIVHEASLGRYEVIIPEMNLGQVAREVQRCVHVPVLSLSQTDAEMIDPRRILDYLEEGRWER